MRTSKRHKTSHFRRADKRKNIIAVLIIIAFGIAVFSIGAIGKWVAERVMVPIFGGVSINADTTKALTKSTESPKNSETITAPEFTIYTIQLGAYETIENAKAAAENQAVAGGANYILSDDYYRLLVAGYQTEDEATKVQEQLKTSQGLTTGLYKLSSGKLSFRVTATQSQLDIIKNALNNYPEMCNNMVKYSLEFDKGEINSTVYKGKVKEQAEIIKKTKDELDKLIGDKVTNTGLVQLIELYRQAENSLQNLSTENATEAINLSSKIKNNYLSLSYMYCNYIKQLSKK